MQQTQQTKGTHIAYLDYLRILATMAVVLIHVSGQNMGSVGVMSYSWQIFSLFNYSAAWAVPAFVMISGVLFLDPERPLDTKKLYKVNIFRMLTAFVFWAFVYALEKYLTYGDFQIALTMFLEGRYHQWYLLMIMGLYIAAPIFRKITESQTITQYFLIITFLVSFAIPDLFELLNWYCPGVLKPYLQIVQTNWSTFSFPITGIFSFYFVLGLYLAKHPFKVSLRKYIYLAGIGGYCFIIGFTFFNAFQTGSGESTLSFQMCRFAMTLAVFTFVQTVLGRKTLSESLSRKVKALSRYTFGAYLVHALVLSQLRDQLHFTTLTFSPILSVLLLEVVAVVCSFIISMILNQIAVLKKYIV